MKKLLSAVALATLLASGAAFAEDKPVAPKDAAAKSDTVKAKKVHVKKEHKKADPAAKAAKKEKAKKCSADADAQKLHGKARKAFRATCMKAA